MKSITKYNLIDEVKVFTTKGKTMAIEVRFGLALGGGKETFFGNTPVEVAEFIMNATTCKTENNGIDTIDTYRK